MGADEQPEVITDHMRAQWLARMSVMNDNTAYGALADLAEEVGADRLRLAAAGERLQAAAETARANGVGDLGRIDFAMVNWTEIVAEEVDGRMHDRHDR